MAVVAIAGERGAVWLGLVECTSQAHIFLKWLDEGTNAQMIHPHLSPTTPSSVQMLVWI